MASLNHVCMWSEHGWKRITAKEAAKIHPGGTVSSHSGLFMCELCGQYVTLTDGYIRERYFKHSASESNKNCPDRTFGYIYIPTYNPKEHDLPIRIVIIHNSYFRLELGLISVPTNIIDNQTKKSITIKSSTDQSFTYLFDRLNEGVITYLSIEGEPAKSYYLDVSNELSVYWPEKIHGIPDRGALFDGKSGKMVPLDDDVQINKKYYLLTKRFYSWYSQESYGINIVLRCEQRFNASKWRVYEIEALELNESAAKFFLDFHCRLTDNPLKMRVIWPIHVETPYLIKHDGTDIIIHLSGNRQIESKSFPYTKVQTISCQNKGRVIQINCHERQQLISVGKTNVLHYLYLWKEPLSKLTPEIVLTVVDKKGNEVLCGEQKVLPQGLLLRVETPFDGQIWKVRDDKIIEKIKINANDHVTVDNLHFGVSVQIFQGLDIVWQCSFIKPVSLEKDFDSKLYAILNSFKGNTISIPHSYGCLALKMKDYPKVKQWIVDAVRKGYASNAAVKYLNKYLQSTKHQKAYKHIIRGKYR